MTIKDSYVIKSGDWEAGVCPRLGANVIYLKYLGKDVLVPLSNEELLDINPYIQGAPLLFPANRTYMGKFSFEGNNYTLPITEPRTNSNLHGILHKQSFELLSFSDTSVTMKYSNHGEVYPFDFDITVTYSISEDGFSQKFSIKNTGDRNMPYTFSLHSTFVEPQIFTVPLKCRQEHNEIDIPTGRYIELTEQEKLYCVGSPSKDVEVTGYFESAGTEAKIDGITYSVSDNFDYWVFYNARGKENYICIEPQAGKVNGLNIEDGYKILLPSEEVVFTTFYTHL